MLCVNFGYTVWYNTFTKLKFNRNLLGTLKHAKWRISAVSTTNFDTTYGYIQHFITFSFISLARVHTYIKHTQRSNKCRRFSSCRNTFVLASAFCSCFAGCAQISCFVSMCRKCAQRNDSLLWWLFIGNEIQTNKWAKMIFSSFQMSACIGVPTHNSINAVHTNWNKCTLTQTEALKHFRLRFIRSFFGRISNNFKRAVVRSPYIVRRQCKKDIPNIKFFLLILARHSNMLRIRSVHEINTNERDWYERTHTTVLDCWKAKSIATCCMASE